MKHSWMTLVLAFALSEIVHAQAISAGLWKANTEISVNGLALPNVPVEDCITAKEAKDIRKYLQENLMPETSCKITHWEYVKPTLKATLSCDGKQGKSQGKLSGKVTEKSFDVAGNLTGEHAMLGSIDIGVKYKGDYQKDCKPAP